MSLPDADRAASFDEPTVPAILTRVLKEDPVAPSRLVPEVGGLFRRELNLSWGP